MRLALIALATLATVLQPAVARQLRHHLHRQVAPRNEQRAEVSKPPVGPLFAVVSIADQHVSFYDANGLWGQSTVSTGVSGYPTPTGVFTILEKERWHRSNIYSGAPMPFMQRLTWTGVALHEGMVTGHPASHGCIRLPGDFARRLFGVTNAGQRVIVSAEGVFPVKIAHAHLPKPELRAPPPVMGEAANASHGRKSAEPVALGVSAAQAKELSAQAPVNPLEFAKALKAAAETRASAAIQSKKTASALLGSKSQEAREAERELAVSEEGARKAKVEVEEAASTAAKAQEAEAIQKAAERQSAAAARLSVAQDKLRTATAAAATAEENVRALQRAILDADADMLSAADQAKEAARRLEPVSIFISRKLGRLYVRQATQHLFDYPITIRDPERPLGTHLFIATKPGDDGASLKWVSLTPPAAVEVKVVHHSRRRANGARVEENGPPAPPFPETASGALDRIEIPQEAEHRISELLWTGATLIISDVGMSGEGRFPMDFMVLTRTRVRDSN